MHHRTLLGLGIAILIGGCSSTSTTPPDQAPTLSVVSGDTQTGTRSTQLAADFVVKLVDKAGAPLAGKAVSWGVAFGGGSLTPTTGTTDANGEMASRYTLGPFLGAQTVTATVTGTTAVTFTATATGGAIALVSVTAMPTGATYHHDTFVRDGIAFVCAWNAGIRIYDIGNGVLGGSPASPKLISSIITNANGVPGGVSAHNAWWFQNPTNGQKKYLFVGQEGYGSVPSASSGDIHIVDVSNLTSPVEVGFIHVSGAGTHNFWMDEANQFLYAAYYNAGVVKIDVSGTLSGDMSNRIVKQVQPGGPGNTYIWGVMLSGGTLYATDMLSGFWALDPVTLATKGGGNNVPERYGSDQWVYGQYAYSGTWGNRSRAGNAIKVWSLDGNGVPTLADSVIIPNIGTVSDLAVTPDGKMLVVTAEGGPGQGLYVFNRANPAKPVLAASYITPQGEHTGEVAVINGRTYVFAARDPGLPQMDIFDITGVVQ